MADQAPALLALAESGPLSVLAQVEEATGRRAARGRDHLRGAAATSRDADLLGIPEGEPVLHHQTWVYDQADHVIEYAEKISAAALYEYAFASG